MRGDGKYWTRSNIGQTLSLFSFFFWLSADAPSEIHRLGRTPKSIGEDEPCPAIAPSAAVTVAAAVYIFIYESSISTTPPAHCSGRWIGPSRIA